MFCHSCERDVPFEGRVGRTDTCPACGADLHCCRNCLLYDRSSYNLCREHQAERVLDKEASNFCEFFAAAGGPPGSMAGAAGARKNPLDGLFKK